MVQRAKRERNGICVRIKLLNFVNIVNGNRKVDIKHCLLLYVFHVCASTVKKAVIDRTLI